jgi:hypothetical protein
MRSFDQELQICKRYFQFLPMFAGGMDSATIFWGTGPFPVEMRANPSLTIVGGSIVNGIHLYNGAYLNISAVGSVQFSTRGGIAVLTTSAGTAGASGVIYAGTANGLLTLDARL